MPRQRCSNPALPWRGQNPRSGRVDQPAPHTCSRRFLSLCAGAVHTDLRPEHFFLVGGEWKLVDLSHAVLVGEPLPSKRGTQPYAALGLQPVTVHQQTITSRPKP